MQLGFIVGGVQKAGTTSLFSYLAAHPELLPPVRKELHHFDNEWLGWRAGDVALPAAAFRPTAIARLPFEATPITLFWPGALERARGHNPKMKLILIFRDPIERAWSHWRMETAQGEERLPFGDAIREGRTRLGARDDGHALRHFSYVERGLYDLQLSRALELFPREQMLLLRSRDLADDPNRVLGQVSAFLGIAPFGRVEKRRERVGDDVGSMSAENAEHLRWVFHDDVVAFSRASGLDVSDWPTINLRVPLT